MQRKALKLEKNTVEIQRIAENLLLQLLMYRDRKFQINSVEVTLCQS